MKKFTYGMLGLFSLTAMPVLAAEQQSPIELEAVEVVGVTPLQGSGVEKDKIPTNVQTVSSEQLDKAQTISLADYINRYLGSVHVNEAQNNPLQPDIYYRGFVASPLMGMPQGLSTYINGVRFNEPFGDSVNWDLIPQNAIDTMALFPGSNPVYGLNTLGGAISVKTKTGFSAPKHQFEAYGGSWDRQSEELTSGWNNGTWGYFLDIHHFKDAGWRNFSPSKADQVLGTLSWRGDKGSLDLTLAGNDNKMRGNGPAPVQLLEQDLKAVFTHPDQTVTRMFFSELAGKYQLSNDVEFSGNAYFRQNRMKSFNGDNSDYYPCADGSGYLCAQGEATPVLDTNLHPIVARPQLEGASNNINQTNMRSRGGTLQTAFAQDLFKHQNNLIVGANYDYNEVHYSADTELASLTSTRGTTSSGVYIDDFKVRLHTNTSTVGVFLTDSFSITDALTATIAGRYNYIHINMTDEYINDPANTLNGSHTYQRLNPSGGLTYKILDNLTVYGNYSESARVPSPMELSCADPNAPCKLPNAFLADPHLEQVVAKTYEGGFRGNLDQLLRKGDLTWNLGYFHTTNSNDIIFNRNGDSISEGYFSNVGKTRRYGVEAGTTINYPHLFSQIDDWHLSTNYTYLNAQFLTGYKTQDPLDQANPAGKLVEKGDRLPGIPEHMFKASLSVDLWRKLSLGFSGLYSGDRYLRGDEANNQAKLSGYWLFNATAEYKVTKNFSIFGKLDNIFDKRYGTFGVYGNATEVLGDQYNNGRFVSPGSPRAGWIGIRLSI
jgi:outer membrane receptor protein involved in Fe transport